MSELDYLKMVNLGNQAIKKVQAEHLRQGIPNSYSINGKQVFELPSGDFTAKNPYPELLKKRQCEAKGCSGIQPERARQISE